MFRSLISVILIVLLVLPVGCASRIPVDVYPINRPSDRVKSTDRIGLTLRETLSIAGVSGTDSLSRETVTWETRELTGRLVSWDQTDIRIEVDAWKQTPDDLPREVIFTVPVNRIEQVDRMSGMKPGPILKATGALALIVGISLLLVWATSKPKG
jgi:hypothetical protein